MEQKIAPSSSESQPQHPKAILSRIYENSQADHPDTSVLFKDIESLDQTGLTKLPKTSAFLKSIGANPKVRIALIEQVRQDDLNQDRQSVQTDLRLTQILGLEHSPQTLKLIKFLRRKYGLKEPSRKRLPTKLALATAAAVIGAASITGAAGPAVLPVVKALGESHKSQTSSKKSEEQPAPTVTAPPTPKPTETPKPTSTPEVRVLKKDLFREYIAPRLYNRILKMRQERAQSDPEYSARINSELNKDRINVLWVGGRKEEALTDSIQILSFHIPTNTVHIISIPRDLQSPEVLQKNKDTRNSRINQAWGIEGVDFDQKVQFVKRVFENVTGLSMDLFSYGNFEFFTELIDKTVGTVEVTLDKPIKDPTYPALQGSGYDPFYIDAGTHQLDGATALKVARSRHSSSDYDRSARQQQIITSLFNRMLSEANVLQQLSRLKNAHQVWYENVSEGTLKPDFDLDELVFSDLLDLFKKLPFIALNRTQGVKLAERPQFFTTGITNRNFVVGAGVPGLSITQITGGNPYSLNPRRDYWQRTRIFTEKFLTESEGEPPIEEEIKMEIPAKETRILYPKELSYEETRKWVGKLRNSHDSILTESLFTKELSSVFEDQRSKIMQAIAQAHARALVEHYGDVEAIIGLDPGHGGSDLGSSGTTPEGTILREKDLTWQLTEMIASEIYKESGGKYIVVFLRPQNPHDEDLDGDGVISPIERLQKRKALLLDTESKLRSNPLDRGKNIVYLSVHLNGSADSSQKGMETYWPNEIAVGDEVYRLSSKDLAQKLHREILAAIREAGYPVEDRGAKEDPDRRPPLGNSETQTGPYIALGSAKLDRNLGH